MALYTSIQSIIIPLVWFCGIPCHGMQANTPAAKDEDRRNSHRHSTSSMSMSIDLVGDTEKLQGPTYEEADNGGPTDREIITDIVEEKIYGTTHAPVVPPGVDPWLAAQERALTDELHDQATTISKISDDLQIMKDDADASQKREELADLQDEANRTQAKATDETLVSDIASEASTKLKDRVDFLTTASNDAEAALANVSQEFEKADATYKLLAANLTKWEHIANSSDRVLEAAQKDNDQAKALADITELLVVSERRELQDAMDELNRLNLRLLEVQNEVNHSNASSLS